MAMNNSSDSSDDDEIESEGYVFDAFDVNEVECSSESYVSKLHNIQTEVEGRDLIAKSFNIPEAKLQTYEDKYETNIGLEGYRFHISHIMNDHNYISPKSTSKPIQILKMTGLKTFIENYVYDNHLLKGNFSFQKHNSELNTLVDLITRQLNSFKYDVTAKYYVSDKGLEIKPKHMKNHIVFNTENVSTMSTDFLSDFQVIEYANQIQSIISTTNIHLNTNICKSECLNNSKESELCNVDNVEIRNTLPNELFDLKNTIKGPVEDCDNNKLRDILQNLQCFGKQLQEDCEHFLSKILIEEKVFKYIKAKYSVFQEFIHVIKSFSENVAQLKTAIIDKNNKNVYLKKQKKTIFNRTTYSDDSLESIESSNKSILCSSLPRSNLLNNASKTFKKISLESSKNQTLNYNDCITLSKYINIDISVSETMNNEYKTCFDDMKKDVKLTGNELRTSYHDFKVSHEIEKENITYNIGTSHNWNLRIFNRNSIDTDISHDKDVVRLINLGGLQKKLLASSRSRRIEEQKSKPHSLKNADGITKLLTNISQNDVQSDIGESEDEEDNVTERQFLDRYNDNFKQELLWISNSDTDTISNTSIDIDDSGSPLQKKTLHLPIMECFLKNVHASDSQESKCEEHDTIYNSLISSKSSLDIDVHKNYKESSTTLVSKFIIKSSKSKSQINEHKALNVEAFRKHNNSKDDLISLSSGSDKSENEFADLELRSTNRVIKPMLRQDQLASETRKAQNIEVARIRRLERKQSMLNKMIIMHSDNIKPNDLILDYNTETNNFIKVDPDLVKHLKPHQVEGVRFMYDACYGGAFTQHSGSGCILAHCMGLGKTLQLITLLHTVITYEELKTNKILVLCPKSTVMNWADEIKHWLGSLKTNKLKLFTFSDVSDINEKLKVLKKWSESSPLNAGCLLIGYEAFRTLVFYHSYKYRGNITLTQLEQIKEMVKKYLLKPGADLIVCDEGHIIKNRKSAISLAVAEIITPRRIVLTGTPIQNNLKEYYSMVNFIKPLFLGTEKEFANLYANPIRNGQHKDSSKRDIKVMKQRSFVLHKKLSKFVQRKEAGLLKTFLPQKYEYVLFIPMTDVQTKLYAFILDTISKRGDSRGKSLITDYTCLRKIWTHPKVLEDAWTNARNHKIRKDSRKNTTLNSDEDEPDDIYDSGTGIMSVTHDWWRKLITSNDLEKVLPSRKTRTMFEILRMSEENEEKCLIFSAFVAVLNVVEYFLKKIHDQDSETLHELNLHTLNKNRNTWVIGKDYYRLDGKTPKSLRHEMITTFNSPLNKRARVFLISAKAGGQGINLIGANRVIILDTSWNPSNDQQNIFRVFRLGQKKKCYIYRLIAMGTMEEKVYSRSVTKQAMSFRVMDEQQIDRHYNMAELAELYTLNKPNYGNRPLPIFPQDNILANLLLNYPDLVYKYHEHDSLLENQMEQELSEQEKADAWASYERDLQFNTDFPDIPQIERLPCNLSILQLQNYFQSLQNIEDNCYIGKSH